jgi:hypothetical protein
MIRILRSKSSAKTFAFALMLIVASQSHARYYDPTVGRFTSADSIVPSAMDPQSLNRYAYVRNNPEVLTDPSGHSWFSKGWNKFVRGILRNPPKPENPSTGSDGQGSSPGDNKKKPLKENNIQTAQKLAYLSSSPAYLFTNLVLEGAYERLLESGDARNIVSGIIGREPTDVEMGLAALTIGTSAREIYGRVVGYPIDSFPGGRAGEKGYWDSPIDGKNNVGFQGSRKYSFLNEGERGSVFLNQNIFGINSIAGLHDVFQTSVPMSIRESALYNISGMAVASFVTYMATFYTPLNSSFDFRNVKNNQPYNFYQHKRNE